MAYNYAKLNGRIIEKCGTQSEFARLMGLSEHSVSDKLNNKSPWKQPEIQRAFDVLDIPYSELQLYFFTPLV